MTEIRLPGADRGSGKVPPIPFPTPNANHRLEAWRKQIEMRDAMIRDAAQGAYDHGYRAGYMDGAHWGGIVGAVAAWIVAALAWLAWSLIADGGLGLGIVAVLLAGAVSGALIGLSWGPIKRGLAAARRWVA